MSPPRKRPSGIIVFVITLALLGAILTVKRSPARGWGEIIAFGSVGLVYLFGRLAGPRRKHWVFGTYMLVAGFDFGLSQVWPAEPGWLQMALQLAFVLVVIWLLIDASRSSKQAAPTA